MDFHDLSFIRSDIDPATVRPLDTHELVRIVNDFLVPSSELLNSFCARFEQRILALDARMDSFERQLLLMERKLADVPSAQQQIVDIVQHEESIQILELGPSSQMPIEKQPEEARPKSPDGTKKEQQAGGASGGGVPAREHPLFGKYFRMLKMGVPEPAVRQKMRAENVDPSILDGPERLMQVDAQQKRNEDAERGSETEDDAAELSSSDGSFSS